MLKQTVTLLATAALLAGAQLPAQARSGGPGGGGMSPSHISGQGVHNSNGPNALDRDKGLDRAEDRMSAQGLSHEKATRAYSKVRKHTPVAKGKKAD